MPSKRKFKTNIFRNIKNAFPLIFFEKNRKIEVYNCNNRRFNNFHDCTYWNVVGNYYFSMPSLHSLVLEAKEMKISWTKTQSRDWKRLFLHLGEKWRNFLSKRGRLNYFSQKANKRIFILFSRVNKKDQNN